MTHYMQLLGHSSPWLLAAAGAGALIPTAALALFLRRVLRGKKAADTLTVVAAGMASSVAATGMWHFFTRTMHLPVFIQAGLFAFMEVAVLTSALRARANVARDGNAGADGLAVWVLTCVSGFMSATEASSPQEALVRLGAPLVAAWLWERSMTPERRAQRTAKGLEDGVFAKIKKTVQQRFLATLGITAADQTALEIRQDRALADVVEITTRIETFHGRIFRDRRIRRLKDRRAEALRLSGAPQDGARRDLIESELAVIKNAGDLDRRALPSPWTMGQADTATPRHGDTLAPVADDTPPSLTPTDTTRDTGANDTTVDTRTATPDTTLGTDTGTANDTDTPVAPAATDTPKPPVAPRPRTARVATLPVQDVEADVARLNSVAVSLNGGASITPWP
jgi:hypothetical protein